MSVKVFLTPTISVDLHQEEPKMGEKVKEMLEEQAIQCMDLYNELVDILAGKRTAVVFLVLERLLVRGAIELGMTREDLADCIKRVIEEEYSGTETGGLQ